MQQAEYTEFVKTGQPASNYGKFVANFQNNNDPRAFGADLMGPDKVSTLIDGMSTNERKRFTNSLRIAHNLDTGGQ